MKARLEETSVQNRGVVLVSENEEEKMVLWDIWHFTGKPVSYGRLDSGDLELVVAPTPEDKREEEK